MTHTVRMRLRNGPWAEATGLSDSELATWTRLLRDVGELHVVQTPDAVARLLASVDAREVRR